MPVRIVEGKLPYTGGTGIVIDSNKVISLLLREENNLIQVNDDNEVYTDLQLVSGITPSDDFPVGVTVGKVLQADGWTQSGLILNWKTTSGDYARWIYANDGNIYFDGGTGTWKQVYYSSQIDVLLSNINTRIDELMALGKFLSLWNCATGQPISFPATVPYTYHTGDYYLVETIDNTTNYKPNGSSYDGTASLTVETEEVKVGDIYIYDGSVWLLAINHGKEVSFANLAGQPTDNTNLANALSAKADATDVNTKTFYLSSTSDLINAQAAYDWYLAGKNPIIVYNNFAYVLYMKTITFLYFANPFISTLNYQNSVHKILKNWVSFSLSGSTVTQINLNNDYALSGSYLATDINYSTPYTPSYDGSPATKKYVDNRAVPTSGTTGYVLTKTAGGYDRAAPTGGISNDTTGTTTSITKIRAGTEAEYALITPDANTIYYIM